MNPNFEMTELKSIFQGQFVDLGAEGNKDLTGIFSPRYDDSVIARFMTEYYAGQGEADAQAANLKGLYDYYRILLHRHLISSGRIKSPDAPMRILEIGCGFGGATQALLELFPNSHVYASELSLPMLVALKRNLRGSDMQNRCTLLQLNAEEMAFHEGTFDLVVGAAILHHLFDPSKVFRSSSKILRHKGRAIFFEPYEAGMAIASLIYQMVLRDPRRFLLKRPLYHYFRYTVEGWTGISTKRKNDPFFEGIDDKWFFSRSYLQTCSGEAGFANLEIIPLSESQTPFRELIKTHLAGNSFLQVTPSWIWQIVDQVEASMSVKLKQELAAEVCIIVDRA